MVERGYAFLKLFDKIVGAKVAIEHVDTNQLNAHSEQVVLQYKDMCSIYRDSIFSMRNRAGHIWDNLENMSRKKGGHSRFGAINFSERANGTEESESFFMHTLAYEPIRLGENTLPLFFDKFPQYHAADTLVDCFSLFFQGHILHLDGFSKAVESVLLAANKAIILNLNQQVIAHGGLDPIEAFTNRGANMTIKLRMERQKQPEAG